MGPHQAYGNIPRSIEFAVDWQSNCIEYLQAKGITRIEAREENVQKWTEHVHQISEGFLSNEIVSIDVYDRQPPSTDDGSGLLDDWRQQERRWQAETYRCKI
jgi:hypothetical protein